MKNLETNIEDIITSSIEEYLVKRNKVKTFHPLDHIFPKERKIRSKVGGLETSLGKNLWERLAKKLAELNQFEVLDENAFNKSVPKLTSEINQIIFEFKKNRLNGDNKSINQLFDQLRSHLTDVEIEPYSNSIQSGEGVDIYLRKNNTEYLVDIKTAQPNKKSTNSYFNTLCLWTGLYALKKSDYDLKCFIAFPYNPYSKDFWEQNLSKIPPLVPKIDAKESDEFWDLLSGESGTTEIIMNVFKKIGSSNFPNRLSNHFY